MINHLRHNTVAARLTVAAALCLALAACNVEDITGGGYSYSDVLPEAVDDFGKDARVIYLLAREGDVEFVLLGADGRVHERKYELVCSSSGGPHGTSCSKRITNKERAPLRGEKDSARVKLGDLDEDIVDDLRDKADAFSGAPVGLRGSRWVVAAGAFVGWVADVDGSHLHRAESPADRAFANSVSPGAGARNPSDKGGSASGPPPDLPAPPGQLAEGRPDFAAFAEALVAMRERVGRRGRILFATVDNGIIAFEYADGGRPVRVKWDPGSRSLVDAGRPFGNGSEPDFPLSALSADRINRTARTAATREHAEVTPGVSISVAGGQPTLQMLVRGPDGTSTYISRVDGSQLTKAG